jgi:hypothetical protein
MRPDSASGSALIGAFALIQLMHLTSLAWELGQLAAGHPFSLLAPAPSGGWSFSTQLVLVALGSLDGILAPMSLVFAWGWFRHRHWASRLGVVVLAGPAVTAVAFAFVTIPSGAWTMHSAYSIEAVLYLPIAILTVAFFFWLRRGWLPGWEGGG